jgi:hypothetical protein
MNALIIVDMQNDHALKVLYIRSTSSTMLPFMRRQRCFWFFALLAVVWTLALSSCMNQEGVGAAEGELKPQSSTGY